MWTGVKMDKDKTSREQKQDPIESNEQGTACSHWKENSSLIEGLHHTTYLTVFQNFYGQWSVFYLFLLFAKRDCLLWLSSLYTYLFKVGENEMYNKLDAVTETLNCLFGGSWGAHIILDGKRVGVWQIQLDIQHRCVFRCSIELPGQGLPLLPCYLEEGLYD